MDRQDARSTLRRFADVYWQLDAQVLSGALDSEDARWLILSKTVRTRRAHEEWLKRGAPRRRASDLSG
jgi:hypothetical protein